MTGKEESSVKKKRKEGGSGAIASWQLVNFFFAIAIVMAAHSELCRSVKPQSSVRNSAELENLRFIRR